MLKKFGEVCSLPCTFVVMMKLSLLIVSLLVFLSDATASKYHFSYTENCKKAYDYYLSLQPDKGSEYIKKEIIADPYNLMATYIADYDDCLQLLFNGKQIDYEQRKHHLAERIKVISRGDDESPWYRLCQAGIYMHWAFVNLRFNDNFKAANNFRKSFSLLKDNRAAHPRFEYDNIFFGIEEAAIGAIPDNYKWIAAIFGMRGDVKSGTAKIKKFIDGHSVNDPLYREALVYYAYTCYFISSDKEEAWRVVNANDFSTDGNLLNSFVKGNIALNYREAAVASSVFKDASSLKGYSDYPILDYEYAYALLHKLDFAAASLFKNFLNNYKGNIYVKDALQKMAYTYYLKGDMDRANRAMTRILSEGSTMTDADKQALRVAESGQWPNKVLLSAQLYIDGGYYAKASDLLSKYSPESFEQEGHVLEYYFRQARVYEEVGNVNDALALYAKAIEIGMGRKEQFGARSALQCGFIYEKQNNRKMALKYYERALSMKDHDFKNAIDQQAKAGVSRLTQ